MGTIFEELIRKFNEALDENPGEHFTPRDVVHFMVDVMLAGDDERIQESGAIRTICDPCCGSGGMLTIATYVWVLTNCKAPEREGKVQLIDASSFWVPMRKSLGDKRREIPQAKAEEILILYVEPGIQYSINREPVSSAELVTRIREIFEPRMRGR